MQLTSTEKIENLPLDLHSNEAAIRKNMRKAGEAIFAIGKHLKHVKENVIESGKWTEWLQSMDIEPRQAQRFIQVYTELSDHASALSSQSLTKLLTLAQISSTVGDISEVIEKPHTLPNGQTKTVDDMTSRQLEQLKRQLSEKDSELHSVRAELEDAQDLLLLAELDSEPDIEIITEYVEVDGGSPEILERLRRYEERFGALENYSDRPRATNVADVTTSIVSFNMSVRDFIKRHVYLVRYQDTIQFVDKITQREYTEAILAMKSVIADFCTVTGVGDYIDVDFKEVN